MAKDPLYAFNRRDIEEIQRAVRFVNNNASLFRPYRRIRGNPGGGGGGGPQLFRVANLTSSKGEAFIECNKVTEVKDDGTFTWDAMQVIHVRVYPFYPFNAAVAKQHYVVAQYIFAASIAGVWVSLYHLGWPFFIEE